jgi:hypothetical protein
MRPPWSDCVVRHPPTADLEQLIRTLTDGGVEFIVVGGAAAANSI